MKIEEISGTTTRVLIVTDKTRLDVQANQLIELLGELAHIESIDNTSMSEIVRSPEVMTVLDGFVHKVKGVKFTVHGESIQAAVADGDTGYDIVGEGDSILNALGNLLRETEFKSKAFNGTTYMSAKFTVFDHFGDIVYGRQRRSDEIFQAEMEATLVPEKGSW